MAKKSAKSKGYRKTVQKKPFLTKKEITILAIIVAVILLAVILFNLLYDDGYLSAKEVQTNDIISFVSRDVRNRYVKVAEANELAGFTRTDPDRSVGPVGDFRYTPDEPTDNLANISLGGSFLDAAELADTTIATIPSFNSNGSLDITKRFDVTVQGHDAYVFGYTNNYYNAPEGEKVAEGEEQPESNVFAQYISMYVDAGPGRTVCLHLNFTGEDDSYYMSPDEYADYILGYADIFTLIDEAA